MRYRNSRNRYTRYSPYSRRKKIRWDRIGIVAGSVIIVLGAIILFNLSRIKLAFKGYSFDQQNKILSQTSTAVEEVLSHEKMENIITWIENSADFEYYDEFEQYYTIHTTYEPVKVIEEVNNIFKNFVPKLDALGFSSDQLWEVLKTASIDDLNYIINHQYTYDVLEPYMQVNGFKFQDMEGYVKVYAEQKNYNYAVLITSYPFINSKNTTTQHYTITNPEENYLTLVKKGFYYESTYTPTDLVKPSVAIAPKCTNDQLRKEAATALEQMFDDAKKIGYSLVINSAYRSYEQQVAIYKEYETKWGGIYAKEHVADPGCSEHQSGLGVDLTSQSVINGERLVFGDTEEYQWTIKNAYKYGYILRFEEGRSSMTGIVHEPWHFRYVGTEAAKIIYDHQWTLEEYCLNYGVIPDLKEEK